MSLSSHVLPILQARSIEWTYTYAYRNIPWLHKRTIDVFTNAEFMLKYQILHKILFHNFYLNMNKHIWDVVSQLTAGRAPRVHNQSRVPELATCRPSPDWLAGF